MPSCASIDEARPAAQQRSCTRAHASRRGRRDDGVIGNELLSQSFRRVARGTSRSNAPSGQSIDRTPVAPPKKRPRSIVTESISIEGVALAGSPTTCGYSDRRWRRLRRADERAEGEVSMRLIDRLAEHELLRVMELRPRNGGSDRRRRVFRQLFDGRHRGRVRAPKNAEGVRADDHVGSRLSRAMRRTPARRGSRRALRDGQRGCSYPRRLELPTAISTATIARRHAPRPIRGWCRAEQALA